jgi:TetR/AcrR family transcriptional regulator, transcriptional repressor for nem operon
MTGTKAERKERSHMDILASAMRLVREKGITGARVADVMSGAGLTVGGFYAHFASKEALVDEVIHRTGVALRDRLFAKLDEKPKEARAEVVVKRYLSTTHRDNTTDGCPLPAVAGEIGTSAPVHGKALAEEVDIFLDRFAELLPEEDGSAARRRMALGMLALMVGGLTLSRALRGTALSDDVLRACRAVARDALGGKSSASE